MGRKRQEQVTGLTYSERVERAKSRGYNPFRRITNRLFRGWANNSRDAKRYYLGDK